MALSIDSLSVPAAASPEQLLDVFDRYGAVLCRRLISGEALERLYAAIDDIVAMQARSASLVDAAQGRPDIMTLERADHALAAGVYDIINSHPEVYRLAGSDALRRVADVLINRQAANEIIVSGFQLRMDLPHNQSELLGWHRDCDYFQSLPLDGVVMWIPLFDINSDSGGISIVPEVVPVERLRTVQLEKTWPGRRKPHRVYEIEDIEAALPSLAEPVRVTCEAGDALIFRLSSLHRSEPNRSDKVRWTLQYRYFSASAAASRQLDRATLTAQ